MQIVLWFQTSNYLYHYLDCGGMKRLNLSYVLVERCVHFQVQCLPQWVYKSCGKKKKVCVYTCIYIQADVYRYKIETNYSSLWKILETLRFMPVLGCFSAIFTQLNCKLIIYTNKIKPQLTSGNAKLHEVNESIFCPTTK